MKLVVGVIALSLGNLTTLFAGTPLDSISDAYYVEGWARSIFVGFLFAIAAFLLAYNGLSPSEMVLSKVAAAAALGVALFPCRCRTHTELVPHVHALSAAVMFAILAYFCWVFFLRAKAKGHTQAKARAVVYLLCGAVIVLSMLAIALGDVSGTGLPGLTFHGERAGLVAFGISWLTASRVLPVVTRRDERVSLNPTSPPAQ